MIKSSRGVVTSSRRVWMLAACAAISACGVHPVRLVPTEPRTYTLSLSVAGNDAFCVEMPSVSPGINSLLRCVKVRDIRAYILIGDRKAD